MNTEQSDEVKQFIAEVIALSKKHGLSIGHEDGHGAFMIEPYSDHNANWLGSAYDETKPKDAR